MGVIVTSRDYRNGYRAEIVDWLLGNTGDWQQLSIVCRLGVEKMISTSGKLTPEMFYMCDDFEVELEIRK